MISNGRTFDYEETICLTTGNVLWSNRSRKMLTILGDTVGRHDFLLTPCSVDTFHHFYPDKPIHHGCFGNLAQALAPYGISEDAIPVAFNCFMNVPIQNSGRLSVERPVSRPGDFIQLQAECDLIIGLTACSAYSSGLTATKESVWGFPPACRRASLGGCAMGSASPFRLPTVNAWTTSCRLP
ncbi:urea carboxylase-associated family protein [Novosphingobium decolorationis]|uniref:Urea carboxylase-associated family protein n=1 Tax=Novosphingobium decolorationis TaxID=2698673 RepID=A0ABX8E068_9SPHN|nr:urea carboxylase-associated family protein [Novosphingobium decolorationis]